MRRTRTLVAAALTVGLLVGTDAVLAGRVKPAKGSDPRALASAQTLVTRIADSGTLDSVRIRKHPRRLIDSGPGGSYLLPRIFGLQPEFVRLAGEHVRQLFYPSQDPDYGVPN